ncbi:hypothetical protein ACKAV7_012134 [Fusarium commune]
MPPSTRISQVQAEECLAEALWTLSTLACKNVISAEINNFPTQPTLQNPAVQNNEVPVILASVQPGIIESVGVSLFVYPYERYKKKLIAIGFENFAEVASAAFTADTFNSKVNFLGTFPNSQVFEWKPPNDKAAKSFVADSIRNSFAHGQSALIDVGAGVQMVDIWNSQNGEFPAANFHVRMSPQEFWQLAQQCMRAFILNAVDHQTLVPFETLLLQVQL